MSKTRRNIGATQRHIKTGQEDNISSDKRVNRFLKKMEKPLKNNHLRKNIKDDWKFHSCYLSSIGEDDELSLSEGL